jgi:hypothetical protein
VLGDEHVVEAEALLERAGSGELLDVSTSEPPLAGATIALRRQPLGEREPTEVLRTDSHYEARGGGVEPDVSIVGWSCLRPRVGLTAALLLSSSC